MTLADSVHQFRLHAMCRAAEIGNVSQACRELGISRTRFYRWKRRFERYGPDGLRPRPRRSFSHPWQVPPQVERLVLAFAVAEPTWGPMRLAVQLKRINGVTVHASTVYRILKRNGLQTRFERLVVLERHSANTAGLLTERTRRELLKTKGHKPRHVHASAPGELVCIDTFYIGKLKGVGKIWQYTACDAATSYGVATVMAGEITSGKATKFLKESILPAFGQMGFAVQRVLTDGGKEFRGEFRAACIELGIRHTKTKPRHPWTNGFVERLHGTILTELWRVAFRRRFFTNTAQMQRELKGYMRFYNHDRPHFGYRLKGRTPAESIQQFKRERS